MPLDALAPPTNDPTPIFNAIRWHFATELLAAAVYDFGLFARLADRPLTADELRRDLGLADRPFAVLTTAMRALQLLAYADGHYDLTPTSREFLVPGSTFDCSGYVGLEANTPAVRALVERLRTDRPAGANDEGGAAFIFREGVESAMERESSARFLTLSLAGRAKITAPKLAAEYDLSQAGTLLDVGGGSGLFAIACLQRYPHLRGVLFDRPEVLKVAGEFADAYGVADRLTRTPGDMFADAWPAADAVLLSNVLHDWDVPQCGELVNKAAALVPAGGSVAIHDVFLDDDLGGPLFLAMYSAALFSLTEGRAYSAAEYRGWLTAAGLRPEPIRPTHVHCGLLVGQK